MRGTGLTNGVRGTAWRLVVVVGMAVSLGACGRSASDDVAIREASESLIAASGNGAAGIATEDRASAYATVLSNMQKLEGRVSNPGIKAAASLLAARAMIGQGDIAAETSRDHRIQALMEIARLRSLAMLRDDTQSLGGALSVYDPTDDLAAIDGVSRQVASETDALRSRLKDLDGQIAAVRGQIGERMERARVLREQDSTIRLSTAGMGATERADAVTSATAIRREADALEKQASELELSAAGLETMRTELQGVATTLEERSALLAAARTRVQDSAKLLAAEASGAQERSTQFRSDLTAGFEALRSGPLAEMMTAYDESVRLFGSAATKAGSARSVDAVNSALTSAAAYQASADVHRQVAQAVSLAAALAQNIGATEAASELNAKNAEITMAAGEALGSAAGAFQGVRAGRDQATADAIAKLVESLEREGRRLRGEPEPEAVPAEGEVVTEETVTEETTTEETPADGAQPQTQDPNAAPTEEPAPAPDPNAEPPADPNADPNAEPSSEPTDEPAPDEPSSDPEPAPEPEPE